MYSIGSLNLLPPQSAPPAPAAATTPAPSTPGDGSFGSALKRAQDKNSSAADDGAPSSPADAPTAQGPPSADADSSHPASGEGADQADDASAAAAGSDAGKPVQPDGVKKPAAGKTTVGKKVTGDVDESAQKKSPDAAAVDALIVDPADDSMTAAKQPKKAVVKLASVKAAAEPVATAVAGDIVKPKKVDPSKKTDAKTSGKVGAADTAPAVKASKAAAGATDGVGDDVNDSAVDAGADTAGAAGGVVGKVAGQKAFNPKVKGSTGQPESSNAAVNAVAAAEAAGVSVIEPDSASSVSAAAVSAIGTATSSSAEDSAAASALTADAGTASGKTDPTIQTAPAVKPTPQQQFVEDNHPKIVTGVAGELLPDGGTMQIRLDPPELGTISVTIHMKAGVMSAAFETSNDDSTRLLTHSLSQLKTSLEATGVSVEKMQVQQSPKQQGKGTGDKESGTEKQQDQQGQAKRDQQRQDLIKRMWAKLAGGDPLDLVA